MYFELPFLWLFSYGEYTARHVAGMEGTKFKQYFGHKISRGRDHSEDVAVTGKDTKVILTEVGLKCVVVTTYSSPFRHLNPLTPELNPPRNAA
jgi:hypothetical protein